MLNEVEAPIWYADKIRLSENHVVIVDDDETIHNLWSEKLNTLNISITHLYSSKEFETWSRDKNL